MIAALLFGLAAAQAGPPAPVDAGGYQTVYLTWETQTKACAARVDGIRTGDPATPEGETALLAALSHRHRAVQLQESSAIPYGCVDTVLSVLRKAGLGVKMGFVSEPAVASAPRE